MSLSVLFDAFIPLLCLFALGGFLYWRMATDEHSQWARQRSTWLWIGLPAALLVAMSGLTLAKLYVGGTRMMALSSFLLTLACYICAMREDIAAAQARWLAPHGRVFHSLARVVRDAVLLAIAGALALCALELPWNVNFPALNPMGAVLEYGMIMCVVAGLYLVAQRHGGGGVVGVVIAAFIGIAQHFVLMFKGTAIMPSDLLAVRTAASVSGTFTYTFTGGCFLAFASAGLAVALLSLCSPLPSAESTDDDDDILPVVKPLTRIARSLLRLAINLSLAVALAFGANFLARGMSYYWTFGIGIDFFEPITTYRAQGFLTGFFAAFQDMPVKVPAGYDPEVAAIEEEELAAAYLPTGQPTRDRNAAMAQFDEIQPTVIAIMNETFSDLSVLDGLHVGYEGPAYFNSMSDTVLQGVLYTSVWGGGTCNSEFEFLTGNSMAYIGPSKYPYTLYDLQESSSLAHDFKELGYTTTAIHPNLASNWERDTVYPTLGFDQFFSIKDFYDAPTFHNGVTDKATYEKILQLLDEDESPQFIFDVTMQNHSAYDVGNIPEDQLTDYQPEGFTAEENAQLNEYLSCIEASDRDLQWFVEQLGALERPVVLIFFGDHQPSISSVYNDAFFEDEDELTHNLRIYQTNYIVWANYNVAGSLQRGTQLDTGVSYLGALALSRIGAPLTTYQKANLAAALQMPSVSLMGYQGADGSWYERGEESEYVEMYRMLNDVQYLEFASKVQ